MNSPSFSARLAGSPRIACVLFIGYAAVVASWYQGRVSWWIGVAAIAAAGRTPSAVKRMRLYKTWLADWQGMGGIAPAATTKTAKRPASRGMLAAQAAGFFLVSCIIWNMTPPGQKTPDGQALMWFLMMGGFLWSTGRLIATLRNTGAGRAAAGKKATPKTQSGDDVVEWILPPASSSPSRADMLRRLPEYAARLISPGGSV